MPREGSMGHSAHTPTKQRHLDYILRAHMQIVKGIASRGHTVPIYYYFDLTAGRGKLGDADGSPLIATFAAAQANLSLRAWFFEEDAESFLALQENLADQPGDLHFIEGDHQQTLPQVAAGFRSFRGRRYGVLYWDGNADARLPVAAIRSLTVVPAFAPLDVLVYLSATARKRAIGAGFDFPRLEEDLAAIGKRHVIVREPQGRDQWSFAILTDWPGFPRFKRHGFYPITGDDQDPDVRRGREIMEILNLTRDERHAKHQPTLDFEAADEEDAQPYFQLQGIPPPPELPGDPRPRDDEGRGGV